MGKQISELEKRALKGSKIGAFIGVPIAIAQTLGYGPVAELLYDKICVVTDSPGLYDAIVMGYAGGLFFAPTCIIGLGIVGGIAGAVLPSLWKNDESLEALVEVYPAKPPSMIVGGEIEGLVKRTYGGEE